MLAVSTFGHRFRFARDFQRLAGRWTTDGELAAELGLDSQSQISAYKAASAAPPVTRVLAIAKRTGVDPGWLAFGPESAAPEPQGFAAWLSNQSGAPTTTDAALAPTKSGAPRKPRTKPVKRDADRRRRSG